MRPSPAIAEEAPAVGRAVIDVAVWRTVGAVALSGRMPTCHNASAMTQSFGPEPGSMKIDPSTGLHHACVFEAEVSAHTATGKKHKRTHTHSSFITVDLNNW